MNKIKLKNEKTYNISSSSTELEIIINANSIDELKQIYEEFNDYNLSKYEILNDSDMVNAIYINKRLKCIDNVHEVEDGISITVKLSNIDNTELRIRNLELKIDELIEKRDLLPNNITTEIFTE